MRNWLIATTAVAFLIGCGPGDTRKVEPAVVHAPEPVQVMRDTFASCTWGEVKGAVASIWSYACGPGYGNVHLAADDALPGFVIESTDPAAPGRRIALRLFDKPAEAPIESILTAVRAASPGAGTAACVLAPRVAEEGMPPSYVFTPEGAAKVAYDAALAGDEIPEPPCGDLGVSHVGDRSFRVIAQDKVAFIDFGSEIQIFDASTLKLNAAAHAPAPDAH
ncbi:MAG: hypothetical protein SGJ23_08930 [Alphaproteobacteria bacterium]|nr:hypothetical protein [Alphaproteobacteria bacterium]